jgi:hypothetical protein
MARRDNAPAKRRTKRQLTANQKEWQHQVQNLKRRIKDLEALGAQVAFAIPEMPARVTKAAIEKIKNIRRAQLEKTAYEEGMFGEALPFEPPKRGETKKRRKEVAADKRVEKALKQIAPEEYDEDYQDEEPVEISRVEIDNLRSLIYDIADDETAEKLNSMLDKAIAEKGTSSVADTIEKRYSELRETAQQAIKYRGLSKGAGAITSFAQILMSEPLSFGELADLERANDYNDNFEAP